ncbi:MAG: hydroxymethylbilane synthase [Rhodothermales bacterium]|nr:hydroxymethylbilane synthase [Rhodothermales bacterium]MBO6778712.1 hydroxymethylbilane synthase [Rhodothermales bacterium]
MTLRAGTRTSRLARWQTAHVCALLKQAWPDLEIEVVEFVTRGDRTLDAPLPEIGGKGLFTAELEGALLDGRIDIAVHSLKDLPTAAVEGIAVGAVPARGDARDVMVGDPLHALPPGSVVGTSSPRRAAQILSMRADLEVRSIRGNVPTRVAKVDRGEYAAAVLARAGLERLDMEDRIAQTFEPSIMLPAPGQGAIGVQCRANDQRVTELLGAIHDDACAAETSAERSFLAALQAGCSSPVGAFAVRDSGDIALTGAVFSEDGSRVVRVSGRGSQAEALGKELAAQALHAGAAALMHA